MVAGGGAGTGFVLDYTYLAKLRSLGFTSLSFTAQVDSVDTGTLYIDYYTAGDGGWRNGNAAYQFNDATSRNLIIDFPNAPASVFFLIYGDAGGGASGKFYLSNMTPFAPDIIGADEVADAGGGAELTVEIDNNNANSELYLYFNAPGASKWDIAQSVYVRLGGKDRIGNSVLTVYGEASPLFLMGGARANWNNSVMAGALDKQGGFAAKYYDTNSFTVKAVYKNAGSYGELYLFLYDVAGTKWDRIMMIGNLPLLAAGTCFGFAAKGAADADVLYAGEIITAGLPYENLNYGNGSAKGVSIEFKTTGKISPADHIGFSVYAGAASHLTPLTDGRFFGFTTSNRVEFGNNGAQGTVTVRNGVYPAAAADILATDFDDGVKNLAWANHFMDEEGISPRMIHFDGTRYGEDCLLYVKFVFENFATTASLKMFLRDFYTGPDVWVEMFELQNLVKFDTTLYAGITYSGAGSTLDSITGVVITPL